MTDFHTHILPDVDDGSRNLAESVRLLHELEGRGFKSVVLTPHFYPQKETSEQMLEKRDGAFVLLKEKDDTGLELYTGCECYLHEYIFHAEDIRPFCIGNTNYLLTELSYRADAGEKMLEMIQKLITKYEIIPVLAHVERYPYIMNNKKMMERFIESGCIGQTNLVSFCNIFVRGKLVKYIRD